MHQLDFHALPRASRERFVRALEAPPPASPICSRPVPATSALVWYVVSAVSLIGLIAVALIGFGGIPTPVQDRRYLSGYVFGCGLLGMALAMLGRHRANAKHLPFQPGVYVFAQELVDARTRAFDFYPLADLGSVDAVHETDKGRYTQTTLWLIFPTQSFTFELRGRERAEERRSAILSARQALALASQRGDFSDLAVYDPFAEARAYGFQPVQEIGPALDPQVVPLPIWASFIWAIGLVSAFVLGVATWRGRNLASDARAFATLSANPDPQSVLVYLSAGGLRGDALKASVLPRARFAQAKKETGAARAEALDRFLKDYPGSEVDRQARSALADTLHAEFEAGKTAADLRAFLARWPTAADAPAAKAKIHAIYEAALADVREHGATDKGSVPVLEGLFAWSEAHTAPVEVRFRRRDTRTLATTDTLLAKGLLDDDGPAPAGNSELARYFAPDELPAREAAFVRGLEQAFRSVFRDDLIALAPGAVIPDDETDHALERPAEAKKGKTAADSPHAATTRPTPDVAVPTMVVDYRLGWNGLTYLARDKRRRFVGIFVKCEITLVVPNPTRTIAFPLKVETPETIRLDGSASDAGSDASVYDAILRRAFALGASRLALVFFDAQTSAARVADAD